MPVATAEQHARMLDSAGVDGCALVGVNISSPETFNALLRGLAEPRSERIIPPSTDKGEVRSRAAVKDMVGQEAEPPIASRVATCEQPGSAGRSVPR